MTSPNCSNKRVLSCFLDCSQRTHGCIIYALHHIYYHPPFQEQRQSRVSSLDPLSSSFPAADRAWSLTEITRDFRATHGGRLRTVATRKTSQIQSGSRTTTLNQRKRRKLVTQCAQSCDLGLVQARCIITTAILGLRATS